MRGVCGQVLPLPRLSALWAGCRSVSTLVVCGGVRVWGPGAVPSACMSWGGARSAGVVEAVPGGVARYRCEGRLVPGAAPPPVARPLGGSSGSTTTCFGRGRASVGARRRPLGLHARWELRAAGVVGGRPWGGWPATVARGVWCQTLSLFQPPALWIG